LNVDNLKDFYRKLQQRAPIVRILAHTAEAQDHQDADDIPALLDLALYDREHFEVVVAHGNDNTAIFQFQTARTSYVHVYDPSSEALVREAIDSLCTDAKKRIPSKRLVQALRLVCFLGVLALYGLACWLAWLVGAWKMTPLLVIVGLLALRAYRPFDAWLNRKASARFERLDGIRIEEVSRKELEDHRRNRNRDIKVGVYTGIPAAILGAVVGSLLTFWLKQ
jgi:hypothetical protein